VRHLLEDGKARIAGYNPFCIQLLYDTTEFTQEVNSGIDGGYEHTAISVSSKDMEFYSEEVILTTDTKSNLTSRKELRRNRRQRKTRFRPIRFNNRKRKAGWLAPSVEHVRKTIENRVVALHRIFPIKNDFMEMCYLDSQKAVNLDSHGTEYQNGPKKELETRNFAESVKKRDKNICRICGKDIISEGEIPEAHHVLPRSKGATNRIDNGITVCHDCHNKIHSGVIEVPLDINNKVTNFVPLTFLNIIMGKVVDDLRDKEHKVYGTYGIYTKINRQNAGLQKHHTYDALMIGNHIEAEPLRYVYVRSQVRRHDRVLHQEKFGKNGIRKLQTALKYINGGPFMKYDCVLCKGNIGFITGKTNESVYVKNVLGESIIHSAITPKKLTKLYSMDNGSYMVQAISRDRLIEHDIVKYKKKPKQKKQ
jgi:N6-L-threonylcarbamoyladenine synthase